jgi:hypothetical protein
MFNPAEGRPAIARSPPLVRYGTVNRIDSTPEILMPAMSPRTPIDL